MTKDRATDAPAKRFQLDLFMSLREANTGTIAIYVRCWHLTRDERGKAEMINSEDQQLYETPDENHSPPNIIPCQGTHPSYQASLDDEYF